MSKALTLLVKDAEAVATIGFCKRRWQARYEEKWSNQGLIIEWQALSEMAEATARRALRAPVRATETNSD